MCFLIRRTSLEWASVDDVVAVDEAPQRVTFGGYMLLERLAMGGMAEVFLARPEGQERFVAIKRILPSVAADDEFIAMFIDEAKIAGQLTHPNIAQILDIGKINTSYFIAMEYVSGQDLRGLWDRTREAATSSPRGMPIPIVCHLVKKLAEALDHAHRKRDAKGRPLGIIHRDVSPQNVLISYDGELKIIDFGIAKAANRIVKTQTGVLKGKFAYMAPEQARGDPIDHRSDVFAIGVILYELLTGERAFRGDTDFVLLEKVRRVEVVPVRDLRPDLPRELERIVQKALSREAGDRYAWASVLAGDLDRFMSDQGITTSREELGAFVRRLFRNEHAQEVARLAQLIRSAPEGADVVRARIAARNEVPRSTAPTAEALEATAVKPAVTASLREAETATAQPFAEPRHTGSELKRRPARPPTPPHTDAEAASPPSSSLAEKRDPLTTGSQRRLRAAAALLPPPVPVERYDDDTNTEGASSFDLSPVSPRSTDHISTGHSEEPTFQQTHRSDAAVVIAACVLGALVGATLGVGGTLAIRPRSPDTLIVVNPRQSEVRLGNRVLCAQTPCAVSLGKGHHELAIKAPGAEPITRAVDVGDGAVVLDVAIAPAAKAIRVETNPPGALVTLDGVPLPTVTPLTLPPMAIGASTALTLVRDGSDLLTIERVVDDDDVWSFELPSPTTTWTLTTTPADALVSTGRVEGLGSLVVSAGRRPLTVDVARPGCVPTRLPLAGTGRTEAAHHVTLACDPLTARLKIASSRRPTAIKLNGQLVPRGSDLSNFALPPGTWTVSLWARGTREQTVVVEAVADQLVEARFR